MPKKSKTKMLLQVDYLTNKIYGAEKYSGDGKYNYCIIRKQ